MNEDELIYRIRFEGDTTDIGSLIDPNALQGLVDLGKEIEATKDQLDSYQKQVKLGFPLSEEDRKNVEQLKLKLNDLRKEYQENQKAIANNEKKRKDHEKLQKAWSKEVAELIFKNISKGEVNAHENWRSEVNLTVTLPANTIKLPEQPQMELEQELARYEVQEIENAIRILKMTDEETVNASTFNKLAQYL